MQGTTLVLLGEVHDNPLHHRARAAVLRRALDAGWRPALVMEQFDIDMQGEIDRSRREHPGDARRLISAAGGASAWPWDDYQPFIDLALRFELPLRAANLPRREASRLSRESYAAVLGPERTRELGLDRTPDAAWQAALEHEIDIGHCGALPPRAWAGMARAQFARDAVMAQRLREHAARGAVLLAGNGHVRRDIGVPRWLGPALASDALAIGFVELGVAESESVESGAQPWDAAWFDAVVRTPAAQRADPCEAFKSRPPPTRPD